MSKLKMLFAGLNIPLVLFAFSVSVAAPMGLSGCDSNDGPVEKAGQKVDEGIEEAGDEIDDHTTD